MPNARLRVALERFKRISLPSKLCGGSLLAAAALALGGHATGEAWQRLTQESWFGSAFGAAIGLIALALAAFLNAALNRARDDRLREREISALRAALGTELRAYSKTLEDRFRYLRLIAENNSIPEPNELTERLSLPDAIVYKGLASQIGLLPPDEAAAVTVAWHEVALARNLLAAALVQIRQGGLDLKRTMSRAGHGLDAAATCAEIADTILGPENFSEPQEISPAEFRAVLAGGAKWRRYQRAEHLRRYGPKPTK